MDSDSSTFRFIAVAQPLIPLRQIMKESILFFQDSETFKAETVSRDGAKISFEQQTGFKYYRTNFWDIQKDPAEDPNVLYISQRGDEDSPDANNVFKIDITAPDYDQLLYRDFFDADGYPTAIVVDDVFGANSLTRVFGLRNSQGGNDINDSTYLTEIGFFQSSSNNSYYLVANSFRDIVFWGKGGQSSQILIKPLDPALAGSPEDNPIANGLSQTSSVELLYGVSAFNDLRL